MPLDDAMVAESSLGFVEKKDIGHFPPPSTDVTFETGHWLVVLLFGSTPLRLSVFWLMSGREALWDEAFVGVA